MKTKPTDIEYYQNLITIHQKNIQHIKETTNNQNDILGEEFMIEALQNIINKLKQNENEKD